MSNISEPQHFKLFDKEDNKINDGYLLSNNDRGVSFIFLSKPVDGNSSIELSHKEPIKDIGNFITANMKLKYEDDGFSYTELMDGSKYLVIPNNTKELDDVYVMDVGNYKVSFSADSEIYIKDINNIEHKVTLDTLIKKSNKIYGLPVDGLYSKNVLINELLYNQRVAHDKGKIMVGSLNNAIGEALHEMEKHELDKIYIRMRVNKIATYTIRHTNPNNGTYHPNLYTFCLYLSDKHKNVSIKELK